MRNRIVLLILVNVALLVPTLTVLQRSPTPSSSLPSSPRPSRPLNLLLVTIDIIQADYVNHPRFAAVTPVTRRLASEGLSCINARAHAGLTGTASRSLLTSRYTHQELASQGADPSPSLQQVLASHGYSTGAFLSWCVYLVPVHRERFSTGFKTFDCPTGRRDGQETTRLATEWIRSVADAGPWFAWVMYWDAHPQRDGIFRPDVELRRDDEYVGSLLRCLETLHAEQDTLVVVTGIHGFDGPGQRFELSERRLRVPLVFWCPGRVSAGQQIDAPVGHVDVMPTLLSLLSLPAVPSAQGRDLLQTLPADRPMFADSGAQQAVRKGRWKLIEWDVGSTIEPDRLPNTPAKGPEVPPVTGTRALFDLVADPAETRNLVRQEPEQVQRLRELLAGMRVPRAARTVPTPDAGLQKALREHGYW